MNRNKLSKNDNSLPVEPNIIRGALNNDFAEVREAIESDPPCINSREPQSGVTALHIAAGQRAFTIVELLLAHPLCDSTIKDNFGRDPLDVAILAGHDRTIDLLMATRNDQSKRAKLAPSNVVRLVPPKP